mmetsp:Transcript_11028/g.27339  ORF Transcript_11028/g.27339 Transcript_11028/m.27339 type:complete len:363 (+) Transcript_11028:183-1271(+)
MRPTGGLPRGRLRASGQSRVVMRAGGVVRAAPGGVALGLLVLLVMLVQPACAFVAGFGVGAKLQAGLRSAPRAAARRAVLVAQVPPYVALEEEENPEGLRECLDGDVAALRKSGEWNREEKDPIWAWKPRTIFTQVGADPTIESDQLIHRGPNAMKALYHWSDRVVLVYFKKEGCSICRVFQPILERVVKEYEDTDSVHFVDVEVLQNPIITKTAGLTSVPALAIYYDGVLIEQVKGAHCKKFMRKAFDTIVASKGATFAARRWAQERLRVAEMNDLVKSKPYKAMVAAHAEHPQQFPPAWRVSHSPSLGSLRRKRFGECGQVVRALFDEGEHHEVTRKLLPAFHSLPGHRWSDRLVVVPNP